MIEKLLTKYFWVLNVLTLTAIAYLLSGSVGQLLAEDLAKNTEKKDVSQIKNRPRTERRDTSAGWNLPNGKEILSRNIFDSTFDPLNQSESIPDQSTIPNSVNGDLPIVPCTGTNISIVALVSSRQDTSWSFAAVTQSGGEKLCRVGDELDGRMISGITWRYLFLRGSSDECFLDLYGDQIAVTQKKKPTVSDELAGIDEDIARGIQSISDTEKVVDRSVVDKLLSNPTQFIRSVRVRPQMEQGKVVGYKIRQFKPDSPLALLGAQRGDIIRAVNGVDLTSVDKALGAYQSLRSSGNLTFSITRNGIPMEISVRIN